MDKRFKKNTTLYYHKNDTKISQPGKLHKKQTNNRETIYYITAFSFRQKTK